MNNRANGEDINTQSSDGTRLEQNSELTHFRATFAEQGGTEKFNIKDKKNLEKKEGRSWCHVRQEDPTIAEKESI